jgi:hypothetical protein
VRIDLQRERHAGVTEPLGNHLGVYPSCEKQ